MPRTTKKRAVPVAQPREDFDEEDAGPINLFRCSVCGTPLKNFPSCYATWKVKARCENCSTTAPPVPAAEPSTGVSEAVDAWRKEPGA